MTTEREKFEEWLGTHRMNGIYIGDLESAWLTCAEQKQVEIDALRTELEQVKRENEVLKSKLAAHGLSEAFKKLSERNNKE